MSNLIERALTIAGWIGIGPRAEYSVTTRVLRMAGSFLGRPSVHSMPDDFYNLQGERQPLTPEQCNDGNLLRDRFAVDTYRRQLTWISSIQISVLTFLLCVGWMVFLDSLIHPTPPPGFVAPPIPTNPPRI